MDTYIEDKIFTKIDFIKKKIKKGEYDNCTFEHCNFENIHASNIQFVACEFIDCNFNNTIVKATAFKDVHFKNCKLLGVKFNECNPFLLQLKFTDCQLQFASFYQLKMVKTAFLNCNLQEVDFTESNLTGSIFNNCDLKSAIFEQTNLEKVNFVTAFSYTLHPEENRLRGATFSKDGLVGLLYKYKINVE